MNTLFDLNKLLKADILEIYSIAHYKENLTLTQYFKLLEFYLHITPRFVKFISNLTNLTNIGVFYRALDDFNPILKEVGLKKLSHYINDIKTAVGNKDPRMRNAKIKSFVDKLDTSVQLIAPCYNGEGLAQMEGWDYPLEENIIRVIDDIKADFVADDKTLKLALDEANSLTKKTKKQILAVDDMPDILTTLKAVLKENYDIYGLTKGEQVEDFLKLHTPDLFLIDIEMPGIDGYALFSIIRQIKKHKTTPIIFVTSNATIDYLKAAVNLGVSDFVKKPFDKDVLIGKIESALNG